MSAQLNLPSCVATLLLEGDVFIDQFTPDVVGNAERIALSRRVECMHDPEITALRSKFGNKVRVDVYFNDGTAETETREAPRGSEKSFGARDDIVGFNKLPRVALASQPSGRACRSGARDRKGC